VEGGKKKKWLTEIYVLRNSMRRSKMVDLWERLACSG
jgi:hypothetical protein